jgi:hypothetical protein
VGQKFGLTRERIRQIEHEALDRLRHPSRSRQLRDYLVETFRVIRRRNMTTLCVFLLPWPLASVERSAKREDSR